MRTTEIIASLVDLLQDKNQLIQRMADKILDLIIECSEQWRDQLRLRKFELHNEKWLEMVAEDEANQGDHRRDFAAYRYARRPEDDKSEEDHLYNHVYSANLNHW